MRAVQIHSTDDLVVALVDLSQGEHLSGVGWEVVTAEHIPAKQKLSLRSLSPGEPVRMYGVEVGRATRAVPAGGLISRANLEHSAASLTRRSPRPPWQPPELERWRSRTFEGYHRSDGRVGTANLWLVVPLVFCENNHLLLLRNALLEALGYARPPLYRSMVEHWISCYHKGMSERSLESFVPVESPTRPTDRLFSNVDGLRFLLHQGGCGATPDDTGTLIQLLAAYIDHPNVAGATVLSLGCQHAQASMLHDALRARNPHFDRPLLVFESQTEGLESTLMRKVIQQTLDGMAQANRTSRAPAGLDRLVLGVKCGASDGFSGISANPVVGKVSDLVVGVGGSVLLGEFPELCGVEQELIDRSTSDAVAARFVSLMRLYDERLGRVGARFDMNPSPGNVRDGLITDAMKSAGAARKGGTSPVVAVLDYPESAVRPGLHLLCSPGNDVESVTALAGAGANLILFTTGMGTPVGNAVAPVLKVSSNTALKHRMPDVIDFDAGPMIYGASSLDQLGDALLEHCLAVASGRQEARAVTLGQEDFIPWRRGESL